jgi:hypothetical protein
MDWKHGEKGPRCFCGNTTNVVVDEKSGEVNLLCLLHTKMAGAIFPLPKSGRPDKWPEMTDEEMIVLVDKGYEEQDGAEPGVFSEIAVPDEALPEGKDLN